MNHVMTITTSVSFAWFEVVHRLRELVVALDQRAPNKVDT
jgi:hypothetical protein